MFNKYKSLQGKTYGLKGPANFNFTERTHKKNQDKSPSLLRAF